MSIGPALRRLMPTVLERKAPAICRAVFFDLRKVAACLSWRLGAIAGLLDIGRSDAALNLFRLEFSTAASTVPSRAGTP